MWTKLIYSSIKDSLEYAAGSGDTERYEYECQCGKGKIVEEHTIQMRIFLFGYDIEFDTIKLMKKIWQGMLIS